MTLKWTGRYPAPEVLRREVAAMAAAAMEALLAQAPAEEIAGIYLKGSGQKPWLSPVDYVPELSDVDVHVLFREAACIESRLGSVEAALAVQAQMEDAYRARVPDPIHMPRPQLVILNHLLADPDYSPSPAETVVTLYGDSYPEEEYEGCANMSPRSRGSVCASSTSPGCTCCLYCGSSAGGSRQARRGCCCCRVCRRGKPGD
jgi:hypothetical protein